MAKSTALVRHAPWQRSLWQVVQRGLFVILVAVAMIPFLFPLYWMIASSLKNPSLIAAMPPLWVWEPTLDNYVFVITKVRLPNYFMNSLIIATASTLLALILGLPAAFSIARYRQFHLATSILIVRILPGIAYIIPWYIIFSRFKLIGTMPAIIMAHVMLTLPLMIWIMVSFFEDLPQELFDAALIDGCSILGVFVKVAVPLTLPGSVVGAIFAFNGSWNNYIFSSMIGGIKIKTLPVIAYGMRQEYSMDWGGVMAAATVIIIPVMIFTLLVQKHIVRGLTFGALKG